jgi:hypothetical protein
MSYGTVATVVVVVDVVIPGAVVVVVPATVVEVSSSHDLREPGTEHGWTTRMRGLAT